MPKIEKKSAKPINMFISVFKKGYEGVICINCRLEIKQTQFNTMTFDDKAKDWDNNSRFVERAKILAEEIKSSIHPNTSMDALDLGCGTGLLSYFLKDDFRSITFNRNGVCP